MNSDSTLMDYLFGSVKLAKNADLDKYIYSGYGIGFNSVGKNVIIFGVNMSSSVHIYNEGKYILIPG